MTNEKQFIAILEQYGTGYVLGYFSTEAEITDICYRAYLVNENGESFPLFEKYPPIKTYKIHKSGVNYWQNDIYRMSLGSLTLFIFDSQKDNFSLEEHIFYREHTAYAFDENFIETDTIQFEIEFSMLLSN